MWSNGKHKKNSPSGISQHLSTTWTKGKTRLCSLKSDTHIMSSSDESRGY